MHTPECEKLSEPKKEALLPPLFGLVVVFFSALSVMFLFKQPITVTAAVYSGFISVMAVFAAAIFQKKQRRGAALVALLMCIVFTGLFVTYAYLAYKQ